MLLFSRTYSDFGFFYLSEAWLVPCAFDLEESCEPLAELLYADLLSSARYSKRFARSWSPRLRAEFPLFAFCVFVSRVSWR